MKVTLKPRPRGPLIVEGDFELFDVDGKPIDVSGRARVALCRCGASSQRPLCDGSHNRTTFEAPAPAVDEDSEDGAGTGGDGG